MANIEKHGMYSLYTYRTTNASTNAEKKYSPSTHHLQEFAMPDKFQV